MLLQVSDPSAAGPGQVFAFAGVYDGHGEWLMVCGKDSAEDLLCRQCWERQCCGHAVHMLLGPC
jgi:hypothetical protein